MNKETNWPKELPWLEWTDDGNLPIIFDDNGEPCFPVKNDAKLPRAVAKHITVRVDGYRVIAPDAPPVQEYSRAVQQQVQSRLRAVGENLIAAFDAVADPTNDKPIPTAEAIKRPETAAWLAGESPSYAPTMFEARVLKPAFSERRRRLREKALATGAVEKASPFVPTPLQLAILAALDGRSLKKEQLAAACKKEASRLYRVGGIKELMKEEIGLVAHKPGAGYYRPDAPPPKTW